MENHMTKRLSTEEWALKGRLAYCKKLLDLFEAEHGRKANQTDPEFDAWTKKLVKEGKLPPVMDNDD